MQAWVEKLIELQEIDLRIAKLEIQLGELPKRRAEAEFQYKAEADALAGATEERKKAEAEAKNIETQIAAMREKKRDFQAKTVSIKNNDEYRAAILQIEIMDKTIADFEEKQLETMIKIDQLRVTEAEKQKDLEAGKARAKLVLADIESRKANLDKLIAGQTAKRPAIVAELEAIGKADAEAGAPRSDYLACYNRLRASKSHPQTVGCVAVLEDIACGRCHMSVTAQLKNETRKGKMVFCPSCGAILYTED